MTSSVVKTIGLSHLDTFLQVLSQIGFVDMEVKTSQQRLGTRKEATSMFILVNSSFSIWTQC